MTPLRILGLYAAFRSLTPLLTHLLNVTGDARFAMWNGALSAVVFPAAFFWGSRWGTAGIAVTWVVVHPLVALPLYWKALGRLQLSVPGYLRALWPGLSGTIVMAAVLLALGRAAPRSWPPLVDLTIQVCVGAATYAGALLLMHPGRVAALRRTLGTIRRAGP